jgi:cell division protein FtsN
VKLVFKNTVIISFFLILAALTGCSSGEYDIEQYETKETEKSLKYDTLTTIKEDKSLKDPVKDEKKDAYTYVVQIGAFIIKSNFDRFYDNAKRIVGSEVYYDFINNLYKIRIGKFRNRAEAIQMLEKVKQLGYWDAFIVTRKN